MGKHGTRNRGRYQVLRTDFIHSMLGKLSSFMELSHNHRKVICDMILALSGRLERHPKCGPPYARSRGELDVTGVILRVFHC